MGALQFSQRDVSFQALKWQKSSGRRAEDRNEKDEENAKMNVGWSVIGTGEYHSSWFIRENIFPIVEGLTPRRAGKKKSKQPSSTGPVGTELFFFVSSGYGHSMPPLARLPFRCSTLAILSYLPVSPSFQLCWLISKRGKACDSLIFSSIRENRPWFLSWCRV